MVLAVVVPLSLLAALLFALAAAFQQRAAHQTARESEADQGDGARSRATTWLPVLGFVDRLVRNRLWLLGWLANIFGFFTQAAALHFGSIGVVQPLLVAQLLFALPLSVASTRCRLLARDWLGGAAICGGLVVLLAVRGVAPPVARASRTHVLLATGSAAVLVLLVVALSRRYRDRPQLRAAVESVAAGICFAMTAVFITLTADDLINRGVAATAVDWPGYALAGSTLFGLLLEQDAFAAGSLATAVAAMTITNPVASYLLGVLAFEVDRPDTPSELAGLASAGFLIVVGVITLSGSPTVHGQFTTRVDARTGEVVPGGSCDVPAEPAPAEPASAERASAAPAPAAPAAGADRTRADATGARADGAAAGMGRSAAEVAEVADAAEARERQPNRRARLR